MWWVTLAWSAEPEVSGRTWSERGFAAMKEERWADSADAFHRAADAGYRTAMSRYNEACALARGGAVKPALSAFTQAMDAGFADLALLNRDHDIDPLRSSPEFARATLRLRTVEWLAGVAQRDAVYVLRAKLRADARALCAEGSPQACLVKDADLADRAALARTFEAPCAAGDPVACIGAAWLSMPPDSNGENARLPTDPERYLTQVTAACDGGVQAGCAEVGLAYLVGYAAFPWSTEAARRLAAACDAGEPRACQQMVRGDLDRPALLLRKATGAEAEERARLWERACAAGAPVACVSLADQTGSLSAATRKTVEAMCADGEASSCALLAQGDAAAGRITVEVARARLETACAAWPRACEEADFLRHGAGPVPAYVGPQRSPVEVKRALFDASAPLHGCLVDALSDDPGAGGWVDGAVRVAPSGTVAGVYVRGALSDAHRSCVEQALLGVQGFTPADRSTRGAFHLPAFHRAEVKLGTAVLDAGGEVARVAEDAPAWGQAFDGCALRAGIADEGEGIRLEFTAQRGGSITDVRAVGEDAEGEAARCAAEWLSEQRSTTPARMTTRMYADVRFLRPHTPEAEREEEQTPIPVAVRADPPPSEPVRFRQLVLVVGRSLAEGEKGKLSSSSMRSIREAHDGMSEALLRMTGGRVAADVEVRWVDATLSFELGSTDGESRYVLEPEDLPRAVIEAIEPGAWESVFIWAPVPKGFPRVHLGTTFSLPVRGATVSTGFIPSGGELMANPGLPAWYLPLHEVYHQVEDRARWLAGARADFPPSNHRPRIVDGRTLDPQDWLGSSTTLDWYEATLPMFPRVFWEGVWARPTVHAADPENVALAAIPFGPENAAALTDRVIAFGRFPGAWADEEAEPIFGLTWLDQQPVKEFVAWAPRGSWKAAHAEVRTGELWARVSGDAIAHEDGSWTIPWTGPPVLGVRWVVDEPRDEDWVECLELEARR